jgi:hypothetical protein
MTQGTAQESLSSFNLPAAKDIRKLTGKKKEREKRVVPLVFVFVFRFSFSHPKEMETLELPLQLKALPRLL